MPMHDIEYRYFLTALYSSREYVPPGSLPGYISDVLRQTDIQTKGFMGKETSRHKIELDYTSHILRYNGGGLEVNLFNLMLNTA